MLTEGDGPVNSVTQNVAGLQKAIGQVAQLFLAVGLHSGSTNVAGR